MSLRRRFLVTSVSYTHLKNGAKAGTEGMSKRMEGIQIQLVEKGKPGPSSGQTAFRTK